MLANRSKSFIGWCLFGILLCTIAGIAMLARYQKMTSCYNGRLPLQGFDLTIERSQQKLLIEQSRKFADKNGLKFDIAYFTPNGENFRIDMIRKDVELVIWNIIMDLDHYDVNFYNNDCLHPTVASDIDSLVSDLKSFISEIPSAKITGER